MLCFLISIMNMLGTRMEQVEPSFLCSICKGYPARQDQILRLS